VKLAIAAAVRKPAFPVGNRACAAAKLWRQWIAIVVDIAEINSAPQRRM
jgi:hypothetical protein